MAGGYAQSMNFIVATIMVHLEPVDGIREGDMFWLAMTILRRLLTGYHDRNLLGAQVDSKVLSQILAEQSPLCAQAPTIDDRA